MIKARMAKGSNKVCLVFDTVQDDSWYTAGKINQGGILRLLNMLEDAGIPTADTAGVCLCDARLKGKAVDYAAKREYVHDFISTSGFNVLVPVGAEAFTRTVGFKGQSKYLKRTLLSEVYPGQKVIPLQNPLQAKYDPSVLDNIRKTAALIKEECEFPDLREKKKVPTHYTVLDTLEKFDKFIEYYLSPEVKAFAYDLETTGLNFNLDSILTIQFSHKAGFSYLIPSDWYGNWTKEQWDYIVGKLRYLYNIVTKKVIGHNKKFDDKFIAHHWKIKVRKDNIFDTMIASFLCNENQPNGLKDLTCEFTDMGDYERELEQYKEWYCKVHQIKKKNFSYSVIPFEILSKYALCDADATFRLYEYYQEELKKENQESVFAMVMRFSYLLTVMEINGWPVDVEWAKEYDAKLQKDIEKLLVELRDTPQVEKASAILSRRKLEAENKKRKTPLRELKEKFEFNFDSAPQKKVLFFEVMKLPIVKYTKTRDPVTGKRTTPSTDKEVMEYWCTNKAEHEDFLLKMKALSLFEKVRNTYVKAVLTKSVRGRIHPTYKAIGAKTGRLACSDPNLQNIQTRSDDRLKKVCGIDTAKDVKKLFKAGEGKVMMGADLSSAEMRYACIASGDKKLIEIFLSGVDIHCAIAKELFPYIPATMSDDEIKIHHKYERDVAKTCQFLSLYGGGADALAKKAKISKDRAQEILDSYFEKYSGVDEYIKMTILFVEKYGYSVSLLGRKRRVPAVHSKDEFEKARAIRQAVNSTIQSIASDGLLISACNLLDKIEAEGLPITLLGPIHDALYLEVPFEYKETARDLLVEHLNTYPVPSPIPMLSDAEWGVRWVDFDSKFADTSFADQYDNEDEEDEEEAA